MRTIGLAFAALVLYASVLPGSAQADPCYGCENYGGTQLCNPFEPDFRFERCEVIGGFCQMFEQCDPVMSYHDLNVQDRIGPGGNYLPLSSKNASRDGRLLNTCTGYVVAEQSFDSVPVRIDI